jgi:hypothetical protein
MSLLDSLIGMHVVEGVVKTIIGMHVVEGVVKTMIDRKMPDPGVYQEDQLELTDVLLVRIDGEVYGFWEDTTQTEIQACRQGGGGWPFEACAEVDRLVAAPSFDPILCSFIRRPCAVDRREDHPDEVLCVVREDTGRFVLEVGIEWQQRSARSTMVLPLSSGSLVTPGETFRVTAHPSLVVGRVKRIVIVGDPEAWFVVDIRINGRSQISTTDGIPGGVFAATSITPFTVFALMGPGAEFSIDVRYAGAAPRGAAFMAAAIVDLADPQLRWCRETLLSWAPGGLDEPWMTSGRDLGADEGALIPDGL